MKKFTDFGLNETLLNALSYMNFEEATEIQEKAIPTILEGKDLIGLKYGCSSLQHENLQFL